MNRIIRPERSVDQFSRGMELAKAIRQVWRSNSDMHVSNDVIEECCHEVMSEFDLTLDEWYYWCEETGRTCQKSSN